MSTWTLRTERPGWLLPVLLVLGLLVAPIAGTWAYWRASADVSLGSVQSGVLHLDLAASVQVKPEDHAWATMTATAMYPGSSAAAMLPVTNNSTEGLALDYEIWGRASSSSEAVTDTGLQVTFRKGGTVSGSACTGGTMVGTTDTRLTGTLTALVSAEQRLVSGSTDQLCVQLTMAMDTPGSVQGTHSTVVLEFPAKSVAR